MLGDITRVPFQELYDVLSLRSPDELAEIAKQLNALPPGIDANRRNTAFFKAWGHLDARSALASAVNLSTTEGRTAAIQSVIDTADAAVMPSLAQTINQLAPEALPPDRRRGLLGSAATKWSEIDPAAAVKFLESTTAGEGKVFADWHTMGRNWAAVDPQAALAWAEEHDRGDTFSFATNGVVGGWWQKDPRAAEAYVLSQSTLEAQQLAPALASVMFNSDPQYAMDWVRQLTDADARRAATGVIVMQLGWSDPKQAADWASTLPAADRRSAVETAIGQWSRSDPQAAADWVNGASESVRDAAVEAYSTNTAARDPIAALSWASTIADTAARDKSVERIFTEWLKRSPDDAKRWVQDSQLSGDQKKHLLALPPSG